MGPDILVRAVVLRTNSTSCRHDFSVFPAMYLNKKKILYVSGSIGLGHVTRDLAIARGLRRQCPDIELSWLACHPASRLIEESGQKLLPEADIHTNANIYAENTARGFEMNIVKYAIKETKSLGHSVKIYRQIFNREQFDLVISDEAYELATGLAMKFIKLKAPFVMIYDFLGLDSVTNNPFEKLFINLSNRAWRKWDRRLFSNSKNLALFAGRPEDIPYRKLGFLHNRRDHADKYYKFTGYILPFNPADYTDKTRPATSLRKSLPDRKKENPRLTHGTRMRPTPLTRQA
jgi:hypothetical protein